MSQFNNSQIIAPPIEEEVYPYRRVWRSVGIQFTIMIAVSLIIVLLIEIFGFILDNNTIRFIASLILVILPASLWLVFSVLAEQFVALPRKNLVVLAVITGLTASTIGIPLVDNFFQINEWITLQSAFERILGYTFTVGLVDTGLKFIVLRFFIFPKDIRIRTDAVAFCIACAIGYVTIINLNFVVNVEPALSIAAITIFSNYTIQITSSIILAYGLSQTALDNVPSALLPVTLLVSALSIGVMSPFVSGLINGALTIDGGFTRPIFSIGFSIIMLIVIPSVILFLYTVALRREREKYAESQ